MNHLHLEEADATTSGCLDEVARVDEDEPRAVRADEPINADALN